MAEPVVAQGLTARERILETAYELFTRRGFRAVGVDEIIASTGVAKATFYRHYPTKYSLGVAALAVREQRWTRDLVESQSRARARTPDEQLLAIFDVLDEWFQSPDFEGCTFMKMLLEVGSDHPLGAACIGYLENVRAVLQGLAREAELHDIGEFAHLFHALMQGSILAACEGDLESAKRMRPLARMLIDRHRPSRTKGPRTRTG